MAMNDDIPHPVEERPDPDLALILRKFQIPGDQQIRFCENIRTVRQVADFGREQTSFEEALVTIMGPL